MATRLVLLEDQLLAVDHRDAARVGAGVRELLVDALADALHVDAGRDVHRRPGLALGPVDARVERRRRRVVARRLRAQLGLRQALDQRAAEVVAEDGGVRDLGPYPIVTSQYIPTTS